MDVAPFLAILAVLAAVLWIVGAPLRRGHVEAVGEVEAAQIADLELAKQSKYREIRELEFDHRTGKLSDEDFRVLDRQLRAEAVAILRRLDALGVGTPAPGAPAASAADDEASDEEPAPLAARGDAA